MKPGSVIPDQNRAPSWHRGLPLLLVLLVVLGLAGAALAAYTATIDWQVIAGGGSPAEGRGVVIHATLGQPVIGISAGKNLILSAGYWSNLPPLYSFFIPVVNR